MNFVSSCPWLLAFLEDWQKQMQILSGRMHTFVLSLKNFLKLLSKEKRKAYLLKKKIVKHTPTK